MGLIAGSIVPISVQLDDGQTYYPRATVYSPTNAQIAQFLVPYVAKGNYGMSTYLMPSFQWIKVIYEIFLDSGLTVLSEVYSISTDIFLYDKETISGVYAIEGSVSIDTTIHEIVGYIDENPIIEAQVETKPLIQGHVENQSQEIDAVINENPILEGSVSL